MLLQVDHVFHLPDLLPIKFPNLHQTCATFVRNADASINSFY